MTKDFKKADIPTAHRILQLLKHLGIERAHFAAQSPLDWGGLAASHHESINSLTLICPLGVDTPGLSATASKLLVVTGDRGPLAEGVRREISNFPEATVVTLKDYPNVPWGDVIANHTEEVGAAMMDFLSGMDHKPIDNPSPLRQGQGEFAGITYRISGRGQPIVLLPLGLASSQWKPIVGKLAERYCTITLGGPALGFVAVLESRGCSAGYLRTLRNIMEEVALRQGESVLEVGCGTGIVSRWLARQVSGKNELVGVDINPYLLEEAIALAKSEGLDGHIEFREGNAEALDFPDDSFDVTLSFTVFEEGDADRMLTEMIRVTKPGGRLAVMVRSLDLPILVNVPIRAELKSKIGATGGQVAEKGCADASLYRRFQQAGLTKVKMYPQLTTSDASSGTFWHFTQNRLVGTLSLEELPEWQAARAQAESEGTFFFAIAYHCAVGTKSIGRNVST